MHMALFVLRLEGLRILVDVVVVRSGTRISLASTQTIPHFVLNQGVNQTMDIRSDKPNELFVKVSSKRAA